MKIERRDGSAERSVLIGMAVSKTVVATIAARWESGLFSARWSNIIGGWCVEHYNKYKKALYLGIDKYFDRWAESGQDKDTVRLVEMFLASLSVEAEQLKRAVSPDFLLDTAATLFNRVKLNELQEQIQGDLEVGDVAKAEERVRTFRKIEIGLGAGINPITDEAAMQAAFEHRSEALVEYPGALKDFFSTALCRDAFIAFMGMEKVGKSFWLQDMAVRLVEQQRNVAYFEVGDNSQAQVLRRLAVRVACRPLNTEKYYYPTAIDIPEGAKLPDILRDSRRSKRPMTADDAVQIMQELGERAGTDHLKVSCHPNSSINVRQIEAILEGWDRDGWHADAIIIDYSDILAPLDGRAETRDQINANWKALRSLSQKLHCLVVTATQTDADSYSAKILERENFSEDKRKYAHVTGMVGINQTPAEKAEGIYRLNWVMLRELEFSEKKCVWCAGCLPVGNPAVVSTFGNNDRPAGKREE